jgi:hypothetical protein
VVAERGRHDYLGAEMNQSWFRRATSTQKWAIEAKTVDQEASSVLFEAQEPDFEMDQTTGVSYPKASHSFLGGAPVLADV